MAITYINNDYKKRQNFHFQNFHSKRDVGMLPRFIIILSGNNIHFVAQLK